MEKITSFTVNHLTLEPGLYVSRKDRIGAETVTTFDLRMTAPNREPVMHTAEMHAIEHLGATFFRNHPNWGERTVYFGPMGCRTGFYLLLSGDYESGAPGYPADCPGGVPVHPGFRRSDSRRGSPGLRELPGYEFTHGQTSGGPVSDSPGKPGPGAYQISGIGIKDTKEVET